MTDAVIVPTARTPIGKAYRGALNGGMGGGRARGGAVIIVVPALSRDPYAVTSLGVR
jgi:hypothetical protein